MKKSIIKKLLGITAIALIPFLCGASIRNVNISNAHITPKQKISLNDNFFVDIAAGTDHSLALDSQGNLWAWGRNDKGQVGNGTTENVLEPVQIMRGHKFKEISAGKSMSSALDVNNNLFEWGNGKLIPEFLEKNVKYFSSTNYDKTYFVRESEKNKGNFLTFVNHNIDAGAPKNIENLENYCTENTSYLLNNNSLRIHDVYVSETPYGEYDSSAANAFRESYSYDDREYGVKPLFKDINHPSKIISFSGITNIEIKPQTGRDGNIYTYAALPHISEAIFFVDINGKINYHQISSDYDIWTYYRGIRGQKLAYDFFDNIDLKSLDNKICKDVNVRKSFAKHTGTSFFVMNDGKAYAVGANNDFNILGNFDTQNTNYAQEPVLVNIDTDIVKISSGENHVIAIDKFGKIYSWGNNSFGQLGRGNTDAIKTPSKIQSLDKEKNFSFNALSDELYTDSFEQGGGSNYTLVEAPSKGTININNTTGDFTYAPNSGVFGNDTAVISIDYGPNTVKYQVNIYIDRKPFIAGGETEFNVNYLSSHTGTIPAMDPDGDNLIYSIFKYPSKGNITIDSQSGRYTYTSKKDCAGADEFTVAVNDGYYTLYTTIKVHIETVITIHDTTDIVIDNTNSTSYSGNLNAKDLDGDKISYSITGQPSKGTLTLDETGGYKYTPREGEYGQDTFTLQATDGKTPVTTTYNIELYQIKDNGTELNNKISTGTTLESQVKVDAKNCTPSFSVKTDGEKGNVTINKDTGAYTYIPKPNTRGADSFVVNVNYGYGNYDVTINVYQNTAVDDTLVVKEIVTKQNTNYSGNVTCTDIDSDTLRYKVAVNPHLGNIDLNSLTGEYTYYPSKDAAGWDNVVINVNDGVNTTSISLTIKIESEIAAEGTIDKIINQNSSLSGNVNASDKDGDTLTYKLKTSPVHGSASVDSSTGDYTYVPNTGYHGNDTFVIEVSDGTSPKDITVNVKVNRKPITENIEYNLTANGNSVSGSAKCTDPDGDTLTYYLGQEPTMGQVILDENTGNFAYVPNSDAAGNDTFIVTATDGNDEIVVTIHIHNETELTLDEQETNIVVNQGKSTTGQVYATDLDGDTLTYKLKGIPTQGMVNINEHTGAWTYTATAKASGTDTFSIEVTDGNTTKTITYNLAINTPSIFEEGTVDSFSTNINTTYNGSVKANDADGDPLTYSVVSQGQKGTVTIDPTTGRYIYTPTTGASGSDSFVIGVNDGNFTTELVINVHIETEVQVAEGTQSVNVDKNNVVTGKTNASDADGDTLTYKISQQGEKGNANVTNDGSWSYFANNGAGDDLFIIEVSDGKHTAYVTIYVHIDSEPSFESGNTSITVGQAQSTTGQAVATDEDGDTLEFTVTTQPTNGTVNLNSKTGEYEYTAFSNSSASSDSFIITVTDGTTTKEVTINVLINNAPEASDGSLSVNQNGSGKGTVTGTDPENDTLTYEVGTQGTHGNVTINSETGEYTYTASDRNYYGSDSFTIKISDGFITKTITINVDVIKNSAPTSNGTSVELDSGTSTTGAITATDKEGDNLSYSVTQQGDKGNAVINEETGEFTYTARPDTQGYDCFIVTVNDGYQTRSFLVEVNINFVDSNNSWAIPTVAATSSVAALSLGGALFSFFFFRRKRK